MEIPPQPILPPEGEYSELEFALIEEQPETFPTNQDSNWGFLRHVTAAELQQLADALDIIFRNRFVGSALEYLEQWEQEVGLPTNPPKTAELRRREIAGRTSKSPFSRKRRNALIEQFLTATFGTSQAFTADGIPIDASGVPLPADAVPDVSSLYVVQEFITQFKYDVGIDISVGVDIEGLSREIDRITPAGIEWNITQDYFKSFGAISQAVGGMIKGAPIILLKTGGGRTISRTGMAKKIDIIKKFGGISIASAGTAKVVDTSSGVVLWGTPSWGEFSYG